MTLTEVGFWRKAEDADDTRPWPVPDWRGVSGADRRRVLAYLRAGLVESYEFGFATCRLCGLGGKALGCCSLTDGEFVWPEGLAHYVETHGVLPSAELTAKALAAAAPPRRPQQLLAFDPSNPACPAPLPTGVEAWLREHSAMGEHAPAAPPSPEEASAVGWWPLAALSLLSAFALTDFARLSTGQSLTAPDVPLEALAAATAMITSSSALCTTLLERNVGAPRCHGLAAHWSVGLLLGTAALFAACVLLGGAVNLRTTMWAACASALSVAPAAGVLRHEWRRALWQTEHSTMVDHAACLPALGVLVGAWTSACFTPLDWGDAWLQWPLPLCYGSWFGHVAGVAVLGVYWRLSRQACGC